MKAATALVILTTGALACSGIAARDATTITGLLASIHDSMANVDNHLLQYHGGPPLPLHQAGESLIHTINESIAIAHCMGPLSHEDVVAVSSISQETTNIGSKFLNDLIGSAELFAANGLCKQVHEFSGALAKVSNEFFEAAKEKFPAEAQEHAALEICGSNTLFSKVEATYAPGACVDKVERPSASPSGDCGKPTGEKPAESASKTSASWGIPTGFPGHHNGTEPGKPSQPITTGAGTSLGVSGSLMALAAAVAYSL
ncbi:hypothetical protein GGR51DRAFT_555066 [Nemania sp. FL0031]|nr:hypothetical protein GGR51DRAFT_555066 [Nemania sp. FL0031]